MTDRRSRRIALCLGLMALASALAPAPPPRPDAASELRDLAELRARVCERMVEYYRETIKAPPVKADATEPAARYAASYEPIELWSRRLADARVDASADASGRVAALAAEVERIARFSGELKEIARGEPEWKIVSDRVEFYRLDAEYRLAREKAGNPR